LPENSRVFFRSGNFFVRFRFCGGVYIIFPLSPAASRPPTESFSHLAGSGLTLGFFLRVLDFPSFPQSNGVQGLSYWFLVMVIIFFFPIEDCMSRSLAPGSKVRSSFFPVSSSQYPFPLSSFHRKNSRLFFFITFGPFTPGHFLHPGVGSSCLNPLDALPASSHFFPVRRFCFPHVVPLTYHFIIALAPLLFF